MIENYDEEDIRWLKPRIVYSSVGRKINRLKFGDENSLYIFEVSISYINNLTGSRESYDHR